MGRRHFQDEKEKYLLEIGFQHVHASLFQLSIMKFRYNPKRKAVQLHFVLISLLYISQGFGIKMSGYNTVILGFLSCVPPVGGGTSQKLPLLTP